MDMLSSLRNHAHSINRFVFGCKKSEIALDFFYIFLIVARNIDCGYTLEPPCYALF